MLENATMRGIDLKGADLQVADVRGADLRGATLDGCNMRGADLRGTDLKYATLEGAILANSKLQRADFARAQLKNVLVQGATAQRANFRECDLENADFSDANLDTANLRGANLKGANFDDAILTDTDLFNAKIEGIQNLRYAVLDDEVITERLANDNVKNGEYVAALKRYDEAIATYLDLKNHFNAAGLYEKSSEYYIHEWTVRGKLQRTALRLKEEQLTANKFVPYHFPFSFKYRKNKLFTSILQLEGWTKWLSNKLFFYTSKYGQSPMRVLLTSLVIIFFYALAYWSSGGITTGPAEFVPTFAESLYFSVVTFTTLGYGDFHPKSSFQLVAISEAFLGAFVIAFFVVVVSRRLIR
jgi:hypothetical protein